MHHYFHNRLVAFLVINIAKYSLSESVFNSLKFCYVWKASDEALNVRYIAYWWCIAYIFKLAYFKSLFIGKPVFLSHSPTLILVIQCLNALPAHSLENVCLFLKGSNFFKRRDFYLSYKSHQFNKVINHWRKIPQWTFRRASDIWQLNTSGKPICPWRAPAAAERDLPLLPPAALCPSYQHSLTSKHLKGGWQYHLPCVPHKLKKVNWGFPFC